MLSIDTIFPVPQQLYGFAADDIYSLPTIRSVETSMGVDGRLSGGFVFAMVPQTISLQADSAANDLFDEWNAQQQANRATFPAQGVILLNSLGSKWITTNGFLTGYKPAPDAKRTLQPRQYEITWERVFSNPA